MGSRQTANQGDKMTNINNQIFKKQLVKSTNSGLNLGLKTHNGCYANRIKFSSIEESRGFRDFAGTYNQRGPQNLSFNAHIYYIGKLKEWRNII